VGILNKPAYADASGIARKIIERFANDEIDAVYVIYNAFKSVMSQDLTVKKVLPVTAIRWLTCARASKALAGQFSKERRSKSSPSKCSACSRTSAPSSR
jgi:F0F1-type ATP synthase gamma subunit